MDSISSLLPDAIAAHGSGVVLAIVEGLARAYVVHMECTPQGLYTKMHYDKKDAAPRPRPRVRVGRLPATPAKSPWDCDLTTTPTRSCSSSSTERPQCDRTQYARHALLQHRHPTGTAPPGLEGLRVSVKNTFVHVTTESASDSSACMSAPEVLQTTKHAPQTEKFEIFDANDLLRAKVSAAIIIQSHYRRILFKRAMRMSSTNLEVAKSSHKVVGEQLGCPGDSTRSTADATRPVGEPDADIVRPIPRIRLCKSHGAVFCSECCECAAAHCESCSPQQFCKKHKKSKDSRLLRDSLCEQYRTS